MKSFVLIAAIALILPAVLPAAVSTPQGKPHHGLKHHKVRHKTH